MTLFVLSLVIIALVIFFAPRPKLNPTALSAKTSNLDPIELENWLESRESQTENLIEEAKAHIHWAEEKVKTPLCFMYIHGFSASWQETAPLTQRLADKYSANVLQARVAGHGSGPSGMLCSAEDWLQSITDQFEIARQIGDKVVIVATSTGAPLTTWLLSQEDKATDVAACLLISPNFRIRSPFGFLLTWPWSKHWIHFILGKEAKWEPKSALEAKVWTHEYSTLSLIEMQKTVDWTHKFDLNEINTPMALMYMENDETIFPPSAIKAFDQWGSSKKLLLKVLVDADATDHVFVGDITAPHRLEWSVEQFDQFLAPILSPNR
ncbi:MAG: esterase/lipase [Candidatus Azotimanducaceae bacterium]|jgi:esterase/lipase